jgi:type I restriction enzyme S subunit
MRVPLPPLSEQQRIAAILERADRLRRLRRYALQLSDTYLQAVFLEMFGDPVRNPKGWPMSEMGMHIGGIRYGTGSPPEYTPSGIPFIRATNVKRGTVQREGLVFISADEARKIEKCRLHAGNLVLVRSGANTGDCALIPVEFDGAYAAYDLVIEAPYPYNVYFNCLINSRHGKAMIEPLSRRAGQPHLNAEQAKALWFPLPPTRLIERFAVVHGSVERLHAQQREAERQAEHLFQALLQRAFRGEG